jgi:hypothetical protein
MMIENYYAAARQTQNSTFPPLINSEERDFKEYSKTCIVNVKRFLYILLCCSGSCFVRDITDLDFSRKNPSHELLPPAQSLLHDAVQLASFKVQPMYSKYQILVRKRHAMLSLSFSERIISICHLKD